MFRFLSRTIILLALVMAMISPVQAQPTETFAVLPFTINADQDISYVRDGISQMFHSRLSWPDKVMVIPPKKMTTQLAGLEKQTGDKLIQAVAQKTGSQYVLSGSITQLAGSFSIDAKVYDIPNKRYMAFFEQSKVSDELIDKVDQIAATINQKVFNRSTVTWEKMEQEKQKKIEDYKRRNPEHLMKLPPGWQPEEPVGWKVWKYLF